MVVRSATCGDERNKIASAGARNHAARPTRVLSSSCVRTAQGLQVGAIVCWKLAAQVPARKLLSRLQPKSQSSSPSPSITEPSIAMASAPAASVTKKADAYEAIYDPHPLTKEEEMLILKPFARAFYRAACAAGGRPQTAQGAHLSQRALRPRFENWILMLSLLLTCLLPPLLSMDSPPPEWSMIAKTLHATETLCIFLSFCLSLCAVHGCVTIGIQIKATPNDAIGQFLVHKWGRHAPDEWWHSFFFQKEALLFFLLCAIVARASNAFGIPGFIISGTLGYMTRDNMEQMYVLNFGFTSRAIGDMANEQNIADADLEADNHYEEIYSGAINFKDEEGESLLARLRHLIHNRNLPNHSLIRTDLREVSAVGAAAASDSFLRRSMTLLRGCVLLRVSVCGRA